jgi:hypothetical protein
MKIGISQIYKFVNILFCLIFMYKINELIWIFWKFIKNNTWQLIPFPYSSSKV